MVLLHSDNTILLKNFQMKCTWQLLSMPKVCYRFQRALFPINIFMYLWIVECEVYLNICNNV